MRVKLYSNGYTKIYEDGTNISTIGSYENDKEVQEFLANGGVIEPEFTEAELKAQIKFSLEQAVQSYLDNEARSLGYDSILSACTYATSSIEKFAAEGQSFVIFRDNVWSYCYQVLADVEAEIRAAPTEAELLAELPTRI